MNDQTSGFQACWNGHSEDRFRNQRNAFDKVHNEHLKEKAPCAACHDTHGPCDIGVPGLIRCSNALERALDFQPINVRPFSSAYWFDAGKNEGYGYLECHRKSPTPKKDTRR